MDNGEEVAIVDTRLGRIGSLQGKVTTIGPWQVFDKYVTTQGNIFGQDDLASFQVSTQLAASEILPLRYWAAGRASWRSKEDGNEVQGPLRKLSILRDGRRYYAVSTSFFPSPTIRKHELHHRQHEEDSRDSDVTEAEENDALEKLLRGISVGVSAQTQQKVLGCRTRRRRA